MGACEEEFFSDGSPVWWLSLKLRLLAKPENAKEELGVLGLAGAEHLFPENLRNSNDVHRSEVTYLWLVALKKTVESGLFYLKQQGGG